MATKPAQTRAIPRPKTPLFTIKLPEDPSKMCSQANLSY
jgi:hypothetical protein